MNVMFKCYEPVTIVKCCELVNCGCNVLLFIQILVDCGCNVLLFIQILVNCGCNVLLFIQILVYLFEIY